jgi:hypothetical protein
VHRSIALAIRLAVVVATTLHVSPADAAADDGTPANASQLMQRVAATYAESTRGVVGVHSTSLLRIDAPIVGRKIANDGWFVFVDGVLAKSSQTRDPRQPPLRDPFRAAYLADYTFTYAPCPDCASGDVAVAFTSRFRDVEHASGRIVVDPVTARIVSETEKPYKLPWPTQDGALVATWGSAGGGWYPLAISGTFIGRIGPFVGHAYYTQSLTAYERFANVDNAANTLATEASKTNAGR